MNNWQTCSVEYFPGYLVHIWQTKYIGCTLNLLESLGIWPQICWSSGLITGKPNPGYEGQKPGLISQALHQLASTHLTHPVSKRLTYSPLSHPPKLTSSFQAWLEATPDSIRLTPIRDGTQSGNSDPETIHGREALAERLPFSEWAKRCANSFPDVISFKARNHPLSSILPFSATLIHFMDAEAQRDR